MAYILLQKVGGAWLELIKRVFLVGILPDDDPPTFTTHLSLTVPGRRGEKHKKKSRDAIKQAWLSPLSTEKKSFSFGPAAFCLCVQWTLLT